MSKTLFEKVIDREIPANVVYEDELVLAFRDIKPQAPTHVLVIPKKPIPRIAEAKPEDHKVLGHLLLKAAEVADKLGRSEEHTSELQSRPHLVCRLLLEKKKKKLKLQKNKKKKKKKI